MDSAVVSFDFYDLLHDYSGYDGPATEPLHDHAVDAGTFDMSSRRCHPQKSDTVVADAAAEPLVVDHHGDTDIIVDYMAPLDCLGLAFPTDDCLEFEAEGIGQLISAESEPQRCLAAATTVVKTPSTRGHQKRHRDAADDDDVDAAGEARGAPRRATLAAEPEQLRPAAMDHTYGARQGHAPAGREPIAAATPMVSCCDKRDAATQVSEAELLRAFGSVSSTRDVSTQAPEDEESSDDDGSRPERRSPVDKDKELVAATPALGDDAFVPVYRADDDGRVLHCLGSLTPVAGISEDHLWLLQSNGGSADFTAGDATVGFEIEDPFHDFYEWY
ncbi:hypothetical protein HU200_054249 [Digitaria exilis]|uniref:Uncharacterized protein n=1 Tax=Digitaria exilis TaxID=1010633 RepID=A0A835AQA9_9POAL|nr:hypothetical protein HU200_054249 [Digitaria exilis]